MIFLPIKVVGGNLTNAFAEASDLAERLNIAGVEFFVNGMLCTAWAEGRGEGLVGIRQVITWRRGETVKSVE